MRTAKTAALVAAAAIALAGCGGDDGDDGSSGDSGSGSSSQPAQGVTLPPEAKNLDTKPAIPKPEGEPPTELKTTDVVKGKGAVAEAGDKISVQYVGVSWSTGQEFDSSWSRGKEPFSFKLGAGMVIPGWDQGLVGMKEGGRRELIIPPDLAYGPQGQPPVIGPNETLVFVVDLEKVSKK